MAQLSRPFQIALGALVVFAAVWLLALHGHSSTSGSGSTPAASTPAPSASSEAQKAAAPSRIYHGSAPGVTGLTRAIAKAHEAVAISQQNAKQLAEKSAQASTASAPGSSPAPVTEPAAAARSTAPAAVVAAPAHPTTVTKTPAVSVAGAPKKHAAQTGPQRKPAMQALVERALGEGKIAVVLFWNPKGTDDVAVRNELRLLEAVHHLIAPIAGEPAVRKLLQASGLELQKKFAAFEAKASQVASFGSITKGVQVYTTPTLLVINKRGQVATLTGLTDAYSIEQAIDEARQF